MFLLLVFCLGISAVSCTRDQPAGCPLPTGPYVPPECGDNEYFEVCSFKCPPQTCSTLWCEEPCDPGDGCCRNECRCKDGYLRDEDGKCISKDKCRCTTTKPSEPSEPDCIPTCAEPNPQNCNDNSECTCEKGYVLSEKGGECIKIEDCPQDLGCNGDENAVIRSCPPPCPSTCNSPNEIPCRKACLEIGCACKFGYILNENDGTCIKPNQCPDGNPCGINGTFTNCRVECPNAYCPEDDSRLIIACDPPYPCPSGCICKLGYRRTNTDDRQCILAEDCPPVVCTRPNEEFCSCPSACLTEDCADVDNQPSTCNTLIHNCDPKCICNEGYFRNGSDICIPAADCRCTTTKPSKPDCIPTCAEPNPQNCHDNSECTCEKGYVLSEKGGECIKIEDCPQDLGCNGDENAVIRSCPPPCPSTCSSPNEIPCRKACLEIGCACKFGYILNENDGMCIKPNQCPDGNPCGINGTFTNCRVECPNAYCPEDDSRLIIACDPPYPCPSGCICKLGYRRTNTDDRQCILAEDCPPVVCTRPNEEFCSCPSACLTEDCADVDNQPSTCNTLIHNCDPKCICNEGYFRNGSDICIPAADCPGQC